MGRRAPHREQWLLRGASLDVRPGERLAVVGPSGSGKTLLLRALAALDPLDEGEILFRGEPIPAGEIPAYRSRVVYLHQRAALFDGNVEDNLRRPFALGVHRGRTFDRQRIVELLQSVGRDATFLEQRLRDLSGGESQIVALARAIQLDPTVLLLDEPTAALDPNAAGAAVKLLADWLAEEPDARALVWVSHDVEPIQQITGRTLEMCDGRLREVK